MMLNGMAGNVAHYCADNWQPNTLHNYNSKLRMWLKYNKHCGTDSFEINIKKVMDFLIQLFEVDRKTTSTIRSAYTVTRVIANAAGAPFSNADHKKVAMLIQGMFTRRPDPIITENDKIWDISVILE